MCNCCHNRTKHYSYLFIQAKPVDNLVVIRYLNESLPDITKRKSWMSTMLTGWSTNKWHRNYQERGWTVLLFFLI